MNNFFTIGDVVLATAGREKGEIFLVLNIEENNLYLINGKTRTFNQPKKKNIKHLHLLCKSENTQLDMSKLADAQVMNFLNNYNKSRVK